MRASALIHTHIHPHTNTYIHTYSKCLKRAIDPNFTLSAFSKFYIYSILNIVVGKISAAAYTFQFERAANLLKIAML